MRIGKWILGMTFVSALVAACGSSGSGGGGTGTCANVEGSWTLSGTCADTSCNITQSGCNLTVSCSPSGDVYSGSVTDTGISFGDASGSCSGSVSGKSSSGSCTDSSGTCSWQASCNSGTCGTTVGAGGSGGGGGTGGTSSGVDCNSACNALVSCCPGMSISECLLGCEQTSAAPACSACFQNTACGSLVPCTITNCSVPQEACPAA